MPEDHLVVQADRKPESGYEECVVVLGLQYPDQYIARKQIVEPLGKE